MRERTVYDALTGSLVEKAGANAQQLRAAVEFQFAALAAFHAREQVRLDKQAQRLALLTRGYEERAGALNRGIAAAATERIDEQIKLSCFVTLAAGEDEALASRLATAQAAMNDAASQERTLQARYAALLRQIDGLRLHLVSAGVEA